MTRSAVFVLPTTTAGQIGPVASWMSTAGWAAAARRVLGDAEIVTRTGPIDPDDARRRGSDPRLKTASSPGWRRRVPTVVKTGLKDAREWRRAGGFRLDPASYRDRDLAFVWQRHELFQTAGLELADAIRVPSVLFVPATHVWQADLWGVRRPGWKRVVEERGEAPALRRARVVCCGTDLVAEQARRLGAPERRIIITPTGVDVDLFAPVDETDRVERRAALGLADRFVVGWVGSFRNFHGLDQTVASVEGIHDASLLFVGDGPERPGVEALARARGVHAVFTGTVPHSELPGHLAAMDVALVVAGRDEVFHYSPLKLAEYLAAGKPVVAPDVPQLAARLTEGVDVRLVPAGDVNALRRAVAALHDDPEGRERMAAAARATATADWSWDHAINQILDHLAATGAE